MLIRVAGDNIMMSPPFIISTEEVDEVPYRFLQPPDVARNPSWLSYDKDKLVEG